MLIGSDWLNIFINLGGKTFPSLFNGDGNNKSIKGLSNHSKMEKYAYLMESLTFEVSYIGGIRLYTKFCWDRAYANLYYITISNSNYNIHSNAFLTDMMHLPGWSENVSHTPGGVVGSEVGVPLCVLRCNSDPKLCPIIHLNFPVVPASYWDQIPQDSNTSVHTALLYRSTLLESPIIFSHKRLLYVYLLKVLLSSKAIALIGSSSSP